MSKDNTYNTLLNKLIEGTITAQEKWQLEKASLDDPFLADAIEGYYDNEGSASDLKALKQKIQPKKEDSRTRFLLIRRLSVAASLVVLMAASFWMFQKTDQQNITAAKSTATKLPTPSTSAADAPILQEEFIIESEEEIDVPTDAFIKNKAQKAIPTPQPKEALPTSNPYTETPIPTPKAPETKIVEEILAEEESQVNSKMDKIDIAEYDDLLNDNNRMGNMVLVTEKVIPAKSKKGAQVENDEELVVIKEETFPGNFSQTPMPTLPPSIKTGIVRDAKGLPLKGVKILDSKSNPIATTDAKGQFNLPPDLGYIITSFSGYDNKTIAVTDNLAIEIRPTAEALSKRHLRLIDQMTDTEVQRHYTNKLNELFSRNWPICRQTSGIDMVTNAGRPAQVFIPTHLSTTIKIDQNGRIDDLSYFENVEEICAAAISDVFQEAVANGVFESGRPIEFRYRINL